MAKDIVAEVRDLLHEDEMKWCNNIHVKNHWSPISHFLSSNKPKKTGSWGNEFSNYFQVIQ